MAIKRTLFTTNVFVIDMSSIKELHERYPQKVFPTIWKEINSLIQDGQLASHVEVYREIRSTIYPQDKLLVWSNNQKKIFNEIDNCQNNQIKEIARRYNLSYWQNQINRPGPWADPYLIAMAICEKAKIITQEHKTKANRIPPIAADFGIRSLNLLELFQDLKIKL